MILVDANLLLYATMEELPQYKAARRWFQRQLYGTTRIALPWSSLLAYLRIATNKRLFPRPPSLRDAWEQVVDWTTVSNVWIPVPTERHTEILGTLLTGSVRVGGNLVTDAHIAALAIEHDLTLCSCDNDFARFPGLRFENPLAR